MICVQSIRKEYRITDVIASGFPIIANPTLCGMRPKERTEFGQRLFDARKKAGLSQDELSVKSGLSQSTIAGLEWSGDGSSKTLQLAAACGVTPEWLATGKESSLTAAWPLTDIVTPAEWALLPSEVRDDVRELVKHQIDRYRRKAGSGESSPSHKGAKRHAVG